ncbi:hypothetical protein QUF54_09630 [Candidatus Marithioploca araucensis]|uniref:Peptidase C14 caspase domain-containing protein n=1 Tax=Candidatus Marithioploca araucensis TaxID=70273 RepID=A0ABT7VVK6_9GAMM|nr:hypothetical protein [Candidatus Marithioploca araucensis]
MKKHSLSKPVIYTLCLLCFGQPVQGDDGKTRGLKIVTDQYALVVGIDQYRHADGFHLINLEGAVNDAHLLRETLRHAQVILPDKRVLLDAKATRAGSSLARHAKTSRTGRYIDIELFWTWRAAIGYSAT